LCRDAKPNKDELAALRNILSLPMTRHLSTHQKTQISKFRYFLAGQRNTIIPFLKSVNWNSDQVPPFYALSNLELHGATPARQSSM
jgi:hypothetical protein